MIAVGVELSEKVADFGKKPKNVAWLVVMGVEGVWRGFVFFFVFLLLFS